MGLGSSQARTVLSFIIVQSPEPPLRVLHPSAFTFQSRLTMCSDHLLQQACSPEGRVSEDTVLPTEQPVISPGSCCALPGFSPGVTAAKTGRARFTEHPSVCAPPFQSADLLHCRDQITTPSGVLCTVIHFPEGLVLPSQLTKSPETMNGTLWRRLEVFQLGISP